MWYSITWPAGVASFWLLSSWTRAGTRHSAHDVVGFPHLDRATVEELKRDRVRLQYLSCAVIMLTPYVCWWGCPPNMVMHGLHTLMRSSPTSFLQLTRQINGFFIVELYIVNDDAQVWCLWVICLILISTEPLSVSDKWLSSKCCTALAAIDCSNLVYISQTLVLLAHAIMHIENVLWLTSSPGLKREVFKA